jgi:hypothetical protein
MTSHKAKHKNYYESHKSEIMEKERTKKRWLTYYEANREAIKMKRDERKERLRCGAPPTASVAEMMGSASE